MQLTRSTFYWLWFLIFGVASALATFMQTNHLGSEDWLLLGAGLLGVVIGPKSCAPALVKPYDIAIGVTFFVVGILGIFRAFDFTLTHAPSFIPTMLMTPTKFLGLSLLLHPAVLHTALGFLSLRYGIKNATTSSSLELSSKNG
ncbi:MAG TPA: hypothetical protein VKB76_18360 [Ktedonobacterales bacterium]|nr:hypothetical protein [Ktedonobacterales bacterium]